jgi:hypothetical protein
MKSSFSYEDSISVRVVQMSLVVHCALYIVGIFVAFNGVGTSDVAKALISQKLRRCTNSSWIIVVPTIS